MRTSALVVLVSLVGAACGSATENATSTSALARPPVSAAVTTEPSAWREIGDGFSVDSGAPAGLTASIDAANEPPFGFAVFGEVFRVDSEQQPDGEVAIRLPARQTLPDGQIPVVVVADSAAGPWEPLLTEPAVVDGYIQAVTPHFSFFQTILVPAQDLVDAAREIFVDATGEFLAEAEQPVCDGQDEFSAAREITSTGSDTLKWCAGVEGGMPILRVVNNRRYPLVASTDGLVVLDNPVDATAWSEMSRLVANGRLTLAPMSAATLHVSGESSALLTEFDGLASSLFQLQVGVETAVAFLGKFGLATEGKADLLLQGSKCAGTLTDLTGGNVIANCFELRDIVNAFGPTAAFIAPLMFAGPLVEFFRSSFNGIGDIVSGRDRYLVQTQLRPAPPTTLSPPIPASECWDGETSIGGYLGGVEAAIIAYLATGEAGRLDPQLAAGLAEFVYTTTPPLIDWESTGLDASDDGYRINLLGADNGGLGPVLILEIPLDNDGCWTGSVGAFGD